MTSRIWVRRESPRIGVRRSGGAILVPAYLLDSDSAQGAYLGSTGGLAIEVSSSAPAQLRGLRLPAEPRRVSIEPPHPALRTEIVRDVGGTYRIRLMSSLASGLEVERLLIVVAEPTQ
jgi:hypothetical protein